MEGGVKRTQEGSKIVRKVLKIARKTAVGNNVAFQLLYVT
jgi:hypothetical protein